VSSPADPSLWTPAQQSWLQAMGYTVFVDGNVEMAGPETGIDLGMAEAAVAPPPQTQPAPARRSAPTRIDEPAPAVAPRERASGARRAAVRMPDRLQIALLRASGCNPAEPETQALMAGWKLDELRGNAAAKRALWPQLRALRKRGRG